MTLPRYIKQAPKWWKYFPYLKILKGCLFFKWIYLRNDIYSNLQSDIPDDRNYSVLLHEMKHLERMKFLGMFRFGFQYIFSRKHRLEEELLAIREQIIYLKSKNLEYDIDWSARTLAGWPYLWCTSYENAKKRLEEIC